MHMHVFICELIKKGFTRMFEYAHGINKCFQAQVGFVKPLNWIVTNDVLVLASRPGNTNIDITGQVFWTG